MLPRGRGFVPDVRVAVVGIRRGWLPVVVVIEGPRRKWLRIDEDVSVGVVGAADPCVLFTHVIVIRGLNPCPAEKVLTELDADGFNFVAFFISGVFVANDNDSEDSVVFVKFCEMCHLCLLDRVADNYDA